ncbi:shikimate dehydrogenase family protein [Aestuariimicrobium kwangyangense]|uniref:shikimate dehydrogenase family protein n=1 Tax=Aestuariimicrobium kwangyangense TaxID=396389 RepID=UPI001FE1EA84|nr:NAD(P)-binding domain-containing protein [Aestuariimicrobium kwangyangense]
MPEQPGQVLTRCAVIGHPVSHSLSPAIHRAAYAALGLDWEYSAVDVPPGGVAAFVNSLDDSWRGLSVTAPHKDDLVSLGEPDETVLLTGAANTWVRDPRAVGGAIVRNTDVPGYGVAFAAAGVTDLATATIVGNGATARSALVGLAQLGVREVVVVAREPARAAGLVALGERLGVGVSPIRLGGAVRSSDVIVSTVPAAGATPHADRLAASAPVVFDSVYDPWPTPLATAAARLGSVVLNGLDLLAGQAVEQIRWHTGREVGFDLLRAAAQDAATARIQT